MIIIHNRVFHVAVNTYVPIFRGLGARGGRKLRTDTHTHTHTRGTTTITIIIKIIHIAEAHTHTFTKLLSIKHMR